MHLCANSLGIVHSASAQSCLPNATPGLENERPARLLLHCNILLAFLGSEVPLHRSRDHQVGDRLRHATRRSSRKPSSRSLRASCRGERIICRPEIGGPNPPLLEVAFSEKHNAAQPNILAGGTVYQNRAIQSPAQISSNDHASWRSPRSCGERTYCLSDSGLLVRGLQRSGDVLGDPVRRSRA